MIVNGRQVADGLGTTELARLSARRSEELGSNNGTTNLAFGMMTEQDWQTYKEMAAAGAAKSTADAQAGEASWDAWAREHAVLAWLSAPDSAQRAVPAESLAAAPVEAGAPGESGTPVPDAADAPAATIPDGPNTAVALANLERFHARTQELIAQGVAPGTASIRAQMENQLGVRGDGAAPSALPSAVGVDAASIAEAAFAERDALSTQQFFDELAISRRLAGLSAPRGGADA